MNGEIVKWGIIATGRIADSFAKAVNYTDGAKLLAVASRSLSSAMEFADRHNIPRSYQGYEELCKDKDIDIVYIATPTAFHYENAKLCLESGKNVVCEKSLTADYESSAELIRLAEENGLFFMEAMWTKCLPAFRQAVEWVKQGRIGKVKMVKADFSNAVKYDSTDRLFDRKLGASAVLDLGVYPITLFASILGNEPNSIRSDLIAGSGGADANGQITLEYEDAFACTVIGYDIENHNNAVIVGNKGRVVFGDWFFCSSEVALYDENCEIVEKKSFPHLCNGYEFEIEEACRCLREGRVESSLIPHSDTLAIMKIMDTVLEQNGFAF